MNGIKLLLQKKNEFKVGKKKQKMNEKTREKHYIIKKV